MLNENGQFQLNFDTSEGQVVFRLTDLAHFDREARPCVMINVFWEGKEIFRSKDVRGSCVTDMDRLKKSDVVSFFTWFTLKPGDTDSDMFENYNANQLEFAETLGEELFMYLEAWGQED